MDAAQEPAEVRRRPGGRSARVRDAALRAALESLTESGLGGTTMNDIARRAGVHASSLIRRWGTMEVLILDAVLAYSTDRLPIPETGSLRGDLTAFAESLASYLSSPQGTALARTMAVIEDDELVPGTRARFWRSRLSDARVIIDRAVQRGEVADGTDAQLVLETLIAPLHFRRLLTQRANDSDYIAAVVDIVMCGITRNEPNQCAERESLGRSQAAATSEHPA
ncbi:MULTISPECIES: TetR/AcrR family transcriptional regulator [unclassified Nocardia]|uniref:TetR/AcrR family transcriptional regulator n=1 Tax=unclassified Nocardia TaxID=2637762 RepID=UPI0033B51422